MDKIKKSCLFRTISLVLILTFVSLDICYAYPPEHNAGNSTLAIPSALQQTPINEQAARFQQSVFSQSALIASVYDIGEYFFGNAEKGIGSLPSEHAEYNIEADLSKHLSDAGTEIMGIVPVEDIKTRTAPEKLKAALDEIGFKGTLPDEGVVFILYKKGGKKFLVQIARKDQVSSDSLPGYEWVVSDKYVVKYMPEDYRAPQGEVLSLPKDEASHPAPSVQTKEAPAEKGTATQIVDLMAKTDELPQQADLLVVFGSGDTRVAQEAAKLFHSRKISKVLVAGKYGTQFTPEPYNPDFGKDKDGNVVEAEALIYKRILMENGVPEDAILVEKESQGMTDNGLNSVKLLKEQGIIPGDIIFMHAPLLQLRGSLSLRQALYKAGISANVYDYAAAVSVDPEKDSKVIIWQAGRVIDEKTAADISVILEKEKLEKIKELLAMLKAEKEAKATISESIAQVEASATEAEEAKGILKRVFSIRAITVLTLAIILGLPQIVFGASGDSTNFLSSNSLYWIVGAVIFAAWYLGVKAHKKIIIAGVEDMCQIVANHATKFGFAHFAKVDRPGTGLLEIIAKPGRPLTVSEATICINRSAIKESKFIELWKTHNKLLTEISAIRLFQLTAMCEGEYQNMTDWSKEHGYDYNDPSSRGVIYSEVNRRIYPKVGDRGAALDIWFNWIYPHPGYSSMHEDKNWLRDQTTEYLVDNYLVAPKTEKKDILNRTVQGKIIEEVYKIDEEFNNFSTPSDSHRISRLPSIALLASSVFGSMLLSGCSETDFMNSPPIGGLILLIVLVTFSCAFAIVSTGFILALKYSVEGIIWVVSNLFKPIFYAIWRVFFPLHCLYYSNIHDEQEKAAAVLIKRGSSAVPGLIKILVGNKFNADKIAAEALVKIGSPAASTSLIKALDKDSNIRNTAVTILEKMSWKPTNKEEELAYQTAKQKIKEDEIARQIAEQKAAQDRISSSVSESESSSNDDGGYDTGGAWNAHYGRFMCINPFAAVLGVAGLTSIFSIVKDFAFAHPVVAIVAAIALFAAISTTISAIMIGRALKKETAALESFIRREAERVGFVKCVSHYAKDCLMSCRTKVNRFSKDNAEILPFKPLTLGINRRSLKDLVVPFMIDPNGVVNAIKANLIHEKGHLVSGPASKSITEMSRIVSAKSINVTSAEADDLYEVEANTYLLNGYGLDALGDYLCIAIVYPSLENVLNSMMKGATPGSIKRAFTDKARDYINILFPRSLGKDDVEGLIGRVDHEITFLIETYKESMEPGMVKHMPPKALIMLLQNQAGYAKGGRHIKPYRLSLPSEYFKDYPSQDLAPSSDMTTLHSINPLAGILGVAALGPVFSAVNDFRLEYPVLTSLAIVAVGLATPLVWALITEYIRNRPYNKMRIKAHSDNVTDVLKVALSEDSSIQYAAFNNLRTVKGVNVLSGLLRPSFFPVNILAIFRECVYTAEEASALKEIITKLTKETSVVTGQEPIYETGVTYKGSRGSDGDWSESSRFTGYSDVVEIVGDYSAIIALSKNPTELRRLIDEELAKQTKSEVETVSVPSPQVSDAKYAASQGIGQGTGNEGQKGECLKKLEDAGYNVSSTEGHFWNVPVEVLESALSKIRGLSADVPQMIVDYTYKYTTTDVSGYPLYPNNEPEQIQAQLIITRKDDHLDVPDLRLKHAKNLSLSMAGKSSQLFGIVESSLNNERAKYIEAGNKLAEGLDKNMATAEIRERVQKAIGTIEKLDQKGVSPEVLANIELLKKNLNQFEADGAVGSLIVLARKAKKEDQKLIIGLETDWIPGINVRNSLQRQAITALMKEIDSIAEALQSMGLDNVEIIRGNGNQLADAILTAKEAGNTPTKMHNIVVMASANTINSDGFAALRNSDESDRPFLTGIDPTELIKLYTEYGETVSKQLYIRLASLLYMTLELAAGKEPPQSPIIVSYDKKMRILMLLPKADPIDYEVLKNTYAAEKIALQAA